MRFGGALAILAFALAACGGSSNSDVVTAPVAVDGRVTQVGEEFYAPEFVLTLADGSTLDSAQEERPLYIMFWAEW